MEIATSLALQLCGTLLLLGFFFPISFVVLLVWLSAWEPYTEKPDAHTKLPAALCLFPGLLMIGILYTGAYFANPGREQNSEVPLAFIFGLLGAHLPLAVLMVWKARTHWPLVLVSSLAWAWASICAAVCAVFSTMKDFD